MSTQAKLVCIPYQELYREYTDLTQRNKSNADAQVQNVDARSWKWNKGLESNLSQEHQTRTVSYLYLILLACGVVPA